MLKAGFIGAGPRSRRAHYPTVQRLNDVEMTAVCEMDEGRLDLVAEPYGFRQVYTNHQEMLEKADLDLVYCVMNEQWLLQPALDCLRAGKHLFIEKPPGANSEETQQLLETAIAHDRFVMVGYQRRYSTVTREAMRRVAAKGRVSSIVGTFNKQMLGGDGQEFTTTMWNDGTHIVDLVRYMAGSEAVEVTAYRDKIGSQSRNCYMALIRFDNGATGVIHANRASGGRVLRAELHGVGVGCYMNYPDAIEILEDNERQMLGGWEIDGVAEEDVPRYEGVLDMHEHFVECIQSHTVPNSDLRDVIHTIRLVDQIEGDLSI